MIKYAVIALFILVFNLECLAGEFTWEKISRENLDYKTVLVDPDNSKIIYAGVNGRVIKTEDAGASWKDILSVKGSNRSVNFLLFDPENKNCLYAATGNGLFFGFGRARAWKKVFKGKNNLDNECTSIAVLPSVIYLGTKGGLFVSRDKGRSWQKEKLGNNGILAIAYTKKEEDCIYAACADGVYRTKDAGKTWERILIAKVPEAGFEIEEGPEEPDEFEKFSGLRHISCDPQNSGHIYAATSRGAYRSHDRGNSWEPISSYGLLNREVKFLLLSNRGDLYAVTKSGVFEYKANRWKELSFDLPAEDVRSLAQDKENNLYAACKEGLFKTDAAYRHDNVERAHIRPLYYEDGPKINEVQQAAIKYAEVESEKIKDWRKKAKLKAVLPKLTVGLDRSEATNYEIYTSATTRYTYEGPRDKSNGWDVTLSWELGDLIWNSDQISIDVRSKLMVELRDNILDEVTRLYFERIRVKMDMDNLTIEDSRKRREKELKLEELSASLDALTGGYFSSHLPN